MAIGPVCGTQTSTDRVGAGGPVAVIRDDQVEVSIVVIIEPGGSDRPQFSSLSIGPAHTRRLGYIRKCAIAVIAVKRVPMNSNDVEILEAIVVVVANGDAHLISMARDAGFLGHVGKSSVPIIVVQAIEKTGICLLQRRQRSSVDAVEVGP